MDIPAWPMVATPYDHVGQLAKDASEDKIAYRM